MVPQFSWKTLLSLDDAMATPHVAILPSPGMGHLIPTIQLANRLHLRHGLSSTLLVDHSHRLDPLLHSLPAPISALPLPPAPLDDLPTSARIETRICLSVARNLPTIHSVLTDIKRSSRHRLVTLVVDLYAADAIDVARDLDVSPYIFYATTAMALTLFLHLPRLDSKFACEYRDLPDLLRLPGCTPLRGSDLLDPVQDRNDDAYKLLLRQCRKYHEADGIVVNSFDGIEPGAWRELQKYSAIRRKPPVYPVGPMIRNSDPTGSQTDPAGCLKWLDRQPARSVLYVSFGSGGVLSWKQTMELAAGLEMSRQRFLWVVRTPSDGPADANFFGIGGERDPLGFLPDGFLERTGGMGLAVPNWAPQAQILGHPATGGFVTHCGWNSTLESVVHGVPMAAWPLYSEQRMNAALLVEDARVAIRAEGAGEGVVVARDEVSRVARVLMEGEEGREVRRRVRAVQEAARAAIAGDGESSRALAEVVRRWKAGAC